MTPAVNLLKKKKIAHDVLKYSHDANAASYGLEACEKLGLPPHTVFKTLVAETDTSELVVALVPVEHKLNLKSLAKAAGAKKAAMADKDKVMRTTGYVLGGVSPVGQKKALRTYIDASAEALTSMYVSAGKRGLEIALSPLALQQVTRATFADITAE